ncbi:MAG: hypothetical protein CL903_01115 [Dehalococcoidia bacterium]|nr:hypothetical protein [Dehalococcoidia bacterium]MQG09592.1 hypothetical protein [SAR202 cluster bacterium]|tara:strand:- start:719 stop:934 length:216 start_codon:yes stop_codon:yes gene_type:complete
MKFNKTTLFGALLGLIMGIVFTVIALFQYDENLTNSRDVLFSSLFIGLPFSIMIGLLVGWIWSKLFGKSIF